MTNELTLVRGDTITYKVTVMNNGAVFDMTTYTSKLTVKKNKKDSNDEAIIGPITGVNIDAAAGIVYFALTDTNTAVDAGSYYYDVEITDGTNVFTIVNSTLSVVLDVTK